MHWGSYLFRPDPMLCPWLSDDIVHTSVCSFWELDCCFLSSCWIIDQSYHYTSRPSIYSTIRIVVLLMGLSISLCEGQSNTCINRRLTHMYTQTQTPSCRCMSVCACVCVFECVCVKGVEGHPHGSWLFFNSGSEDVRKCAYIMATHAGSTVLQKSGCPSTSQETPD